MRSVYHEGELAVQKRTGSLEMSARIGNGIRPEIAPPMRAFLAEQRLLIVGSRDQAGRLWASPLSGAAGFARALDAHTVRISATPTPGDPLADALKADQAEIGVLAIDVATRRRIRLNGSAHLRADGQIDLYTREVFGNCPKYIQARHLEHEPATATRQPLLQRGASLSPTRHNLIARADTFFIATAHQSGRTDASHRGGMPGFVQVIDGKTLRFPDYQGNMMFQTLGNIEANPQAGLLFIDFTNGMILQLTGAARILWNPAEFADMPGAERAVEIRIEEVREISSGLPLRGEGVHYSPFNPR